jgi:hypothetical protein
MKPSVITTFDKLIPRKHSFIKTINDSLKKIFNLEHNRHRAFINFLVNIIACLVAYFPT